jgi:hypothetical protein
MKLDFSMETTEDIGAMTSKRLPGGWSAVQG